MDHHFADLKDIVIAKLINLKTPHSLSVSCRVSCLNVFACKEHALCFYLLKTLGFHLTKYTALFLFHFPHSSWFHLLFCHSKLGVLSSALSALGLEVTAHTHLQWRTSGSLPEAQPLCPRSLKNANPKDPTHTQKAGGLHVEGNFSISFPSEHVSQPMFSSAIRTPPFTSFWGTEGTNLLESLLLIVSQALYRKSPGIFFFNTTMLIQANIILPALPCPPHSFRKMLTT